MHLNYEILMRVSIYVYFFAPLLLANARSESVFQDSSLNFTIDATAQIKDAVEDVKKLDGSWMLLQGFAASFSMIIVSEIGDKTFFIAAIMAMKQKRLTVFAGATLALTTMTILSVAFGSVAALIPRMYTRYISSALFAIFGLKMIKDGVNAKPDGVKEEMEEVQTKLQEKEEDSEKELNTVKEKDIETPEPIKNEAKEPKQIMITFRVILQAFTLTFLAEWGDRSQLSTVILAATENVYSVTLGAIAGHSICTAVAVLGGRMLAQKISIRTVLLIGGVVFLIFAITTLLLQPM